jgi:membrane-associated phospholipid phosphatase
LSRTAVLLVLLLLQTVSSSAQTADSEREAIQRAFDQVWKDQRRVWTAPVRKETWEKSFPFALVGVTTASFALDGGPARRLRENPDFECFNEILAYRRVGQFLAAYPVLALAAGTLSGSEDWARYGQRTARVALSTYVVVSALRLATQRARPHTGHVYGFWEGGNSFPSGHSSLSFAMAVVAVDHFEDHRWVPWVAYPLAGAIAGSRITSGHHFFSDVAAGTFIGFAVGRYLPR